ncbi:MAG: hypothetical protein R3194_05255 [Limnobacter sp.]|nr:hypothetical protein [Limnobacter sp.]
MVLFLKSIIDTLQQGGGLSGGGQADLSRTPEWNSLAERRKEIEADPLLDESAKQSLIQSWQDMAESSRQLLERKSTAPTNRSLAIPPIVFAVLCLVLAFGLFWTIGGIHSQATDWPEFSVDRTGASGGRSLVTSSEHPGDGASLDQRLQGLQARLEQNPGDIQGWVLLARTQAAMSLYSDSVQSLKKALELVPGHPGLLADTADMIAMSNDRQMAGEPLELVRQALANDPFHEKSLALAATAAEQAGDNETAQMYWQRLSEAQQRKAAAQAAAPPSAPQMVANGPLIAQATVRLPGPLFEKASASAVLFVFLKGSATEGMPLAVQRVPLAQLQAGQTTVPIAQSNLIGGQSIDTLPNVVYAQARVFMAGSVQPSPQDWVSQWVQADYSGSPLELELSLQEQ